MGGAVIAQRHLAHLAEAGWSIAAVCGGGDDAFFRARFPRWKCAGLPRRRWWWPPFKPEPSALARLRSRFFRQALRRSGIGRDDAEVIVTICWGPASWEAAQLANAWRRPLAAIVHDWWAECGGDRDARIGEHVGRTAKRVFVVSEEMRAALSDFGAQKLEVLHPVPEKRATGFATWRDEFARAPVIAHVGTLHPYHAPYLTAVAGELAARGGRVVVLCPADNPTLASLRATVRNIEHRDLFADNADAVRWIAACATAVTVMYAQQVGARGHPPTGFPSRLVEFSQTGLPILLAAPRGNPVRTWAERRGWNACVAPDDHDGLSRCVSRLADRTTWEQWAAQTRDAATSDFDPDRLHARFARTLEALRSGA